MIFYEDEDDDDWGFFVEIDIDTENCRKYSYLKCYNEWRKYNLEIIEEGGYEDYDFDFDFELELYSNKNKNVYNYNNNYNNNNNNNSTSCYKTINCINSFIPYFCIISVVIYCQFL